MLELARNSVGRAARTSVFEVMFRVRYLSSSCWKLRRLFRVPSVGGLHDLAHDLAHGLAHDLAHDTGCELFDLRDLARVSWVSSVLYTYRPRITSHNGSNRICCRL